eukprot:3214119-Pyramimonas_sp.AAC.1
MLMPRPEETRTGPGFLLGGVCADVASPGGVHARPLVPHPAEVLPELPPQAFHSLGVALVAEGGELHPLQRGLYMHWPVRGSFRSCDGSDRASARRGQRADRASAQGAARA